MKFDNWYFQRWAREQTLGNATRKLILTSLAITAESNTGSGFMAQADLAEYAECSVRTVSGHLKALEEEGFLVRQRRFSRYGRRIADGFLLLAPGVIEWPDGTEIERLTTGSRLPPVDSSSGSQTSSPPEVPRRDHRKPRAAEQEQPIEQPTEEPNTNAHDARTVGEAVTYRKENVPVEVVNDAERLLTVFCEATGRHVGAYGRSGKPSAELKQVIGALLSRSESADTWERGIRAFVADPPDWIETPWQIGVVFGERAASWVITAATGQPRQAHGRMSEKERMIVQSRERARQAHERIVASEQRELSQ